MDAEARVAAAPRTGRRARKEEGATPRLLPQRDKGEAAAQALAVWERWTAREGATARRKKAADAGPGVPTKALNRRGAHRKTAGNMVQVGWAGKKMGQKKKQ